MCKVTLIVVSARLSVLRVVYVRLECVWASASFHTGRP